MGLLRHGKLMVGLDLGEQYSQISYSTDDVSVETLSCVAGEEVFNIPTVLCKRIGANQWFYGREALQYAETQEGILVENVLHLAVVGEWVLIDGNPYDPVTLLTLFMKRCLGMLSLVSSPEKITALMITCEKMNTRMVEVLNQAVKGLSLKTDKIFFQNHEESFFHYVIKQPMELWTSQSLLIEYRGTRVICYCMGLNKRTTPVVSYIESWEYSMSPYDPMPEDEELRRAKMERLDQEFDDIATQVLKRTPVSSVYLIGENYSEEWMRISLRDLCMGRRVFQGNNLFGKGACYALIERYKPSEIGNKYIFLGKEKGKANIGMRLLSQGKECYYAILDAGVNWYESSHEFEFYMRGGNELEVEVISLIGGETRTEKVELSDMLPGMSRMRARFSMKSDHELVLEVEDLGFGNFREATHRIWVKEVEL